MALSKEAPGFDIDDEVLLMEPGIVLDVMSDEEPAAPAVLRVLYRPSPTSKPRLQCLQPVQPRPAGDGHLMAF